MIEGERGSAIVEHVVVLRSAALVDGDTLTTTLLSAVLAQALRSGESPRKIIVQLFDVLPSDEEWAIVAREKFEQAVDELEAKGL